MGIRTLVAGTLGVLALPATALAIAVPTGPGNGATVPTPAVTWTMDAGDHAKEVQLATSSARVSAAGPFVEDTVALHATVTDAATSWTWSGDLQERPWAGRYYWLVETQRADAVIEYSSVRSFVLKTRLDCSPPRTQNKKHRTLYLTATCNSNAHRVRFVFAIKAGRKLVKAFSKTVTLSHPDIPTGASFKWALPITIRRGARLTVTGTYTANGSKVKRSIPATAP